MLLIATFITDSIHHTKQHGVTALMKASRQGYVDVVETLIARQAVLDLKSHVRLLTLNKILRTHRYGIGFPRVHDKQQD